MCIKSIAPHLNGLFSSGLSPIPLSKFLENKIEMHSRFTLVKKWTCQLLHILDTLHYDLGISSNNIRLTTLTVDDLHNLGTTPQTFQQATLLHGVNNMVHDQWFHCMQEKRYFPPELCEMADRKKARVTVRIDNFASGIILGALLSWAFLGRAVFPVWFEKADECSNGWFAVVHQWALSRPKKKFKDMEHFMRKIDKQPETENISRTIRTILNKNNRNIRDLTHLELNKYKSLIPYMKGLHWMSIWTHKPEHIAEMKQAYEELSAEQKNFVVELSQLIAQYLDFVYEFGEEEEDRSNLEYGISALCDENNTIQIDSETKGFFDSLKHPVWNNKHRKCPFQERMSPLGEWLRKKLAAVPMSEDNVNEMEHAIHESVQQLPHQTQTKYKDVLEWYFNTLDDLETVI